MRLRSATFTPSLAALTLAAALAGCGGSGSASSGQRASRQTPSTSSVQSTVTQDNTANGTTPGPEGVPLQAGAFLAPASTAAQGQTVDGIRCQPNEQVAYHIHVHLQVYENGLPRALPGGIGIAGPVEQQTPAGPFYGASECYYWLHTHTSDGVIHVESPTQRVYTLGDFFDEWHQPLGTTRVASLSGPVTASVNGKPWTKSPRDIPLLPQSQIQLAVGQPLPPYRPISWARTGL